MNSSQFLCTWTLGLGCLLFAGCTTTSLGVGKSGETPSLTEQKFATSKEKLKDPIKLHLNYARWQEHIGNLSEARDSYEFIIAEEPESVDAVLGLARIDQLSGRTHEAEQGFRKALKLSPNDPQALGAIGQFYAAEQRWGEAIQFLKNATSASPSDRAIRFNYAVALANSGNIDAALPEFTQSIGEAEAHYNIGLVLYETGDLAASEQHFARAVMINPELSEAQYWLSELRGEEAKSPAIAANSSGARYEELPPPRPSSQQTGLSAPNPRRSGSIQQTAATRPATPHRSRTGQAAAPLPRSSRRPVITSRQDSTSPVVPANRISAGPQSSATPRTSATQAPPAGLTPEQLEQWQNQSRASVGR